MRFLRRLWNLLFGVPVAVASPPEEGTLQWFSQMKGYGYIRCARRLPPSPRSAADGGDVFFLRGALRGGFDPREGTTVTFIVRPKNAHWRVREAECVMAGEQTEGQIRAVRDAGSSGSPGLPRLVHTHVEAERLAAGSRVGG